MRIAKSRWFCVLFASAQFAFAAEPPAPPEAAAPAKSRYDAAVEKVRKQYDSAIADALGKFDVLIAKAKSDSKLDLALALKEEKERASKSAPLGTLAPEVKAARQAFDTDNQKAKSDFEAHAREAHAAFVKELDELALSEVDANRFDSAKAIRAYRANIERMGPALLGAPAANPPAPAPVIKNREFGWRYGEEKARLLKTEGGTDQSEAAVTAGLAWLAKQQKPDGSWDLANEPRKVAATGIALLPFLAAGQTHRNPSDDNPAQVDKTRPNYHQQIDKGLKYLMSKQTRAGDFGPGSMYEHAIATMALCEACGMTTDSRFHAHAQSAIDYIVKAQHAAGGWRYTPKQAGDTSVTGWQIQALRTAQMAGLKVPKETLTKAMAFLNSVATGDPSGSTFGYVNRTPSQSMTAVGLLCRRYLGWDQKNATFMAGIEALKRVPPRDLGNAADNRPMDIYYYYYATQVMHHFGGPDWQEFWNPKMRDWLVSLQIGGTGVNAGSWNADGTMTGVAGGRLLSTSMTLLMLEVYYRFPRLEKEAKSTH